MAPAGCSIESFSSRAKRVPGRQNRRIKGQNTLFFFYDRIDYWQSHLAKLIRAATGLRAEEF
jgi:hypothetical protein